MKSPCVTEMLQALHRCRERQPVVRDTTPFSIVLEHPPFCLRRYHLGDHTSGGHPVLIVYSTINRPDLLDLSRKRSMIRHLLQAGLDVYLLDWGYPLDADHLLDLEDYLDGFLHQAVGHIQAQRGSGKGIDAIGICQGGTLLTCYAALRPDRIRTLANIGTPLDFHVEPNVLTRLAGALTPPTPTSWNVNGQVLAASFAALRPTDLFIRRYEALPMLSRQEDLLDEFLHTEAWMYDCPDQPAAMFWSFVSQFYLTNALITGELAIGGSTVRLEHIEAAVLNIHAEDDHLVPPASTRPGGLMRSARSYRELACSGGHLGLFIGSQARLHVIPALTNWIKSDGEDLASFYL